MERLITVEEVYTRAGNAALERVYSLLGDAFKRSEVVSINQLIMGGSDNPRKDVVILTHFKSRAAADCLTAQLSENEDEIAKHILVNQGRL